MMKNIKLLLLLIFFSLSVDGAYIVLKNGKKGSITIDDTAALYDTAKTSFIAITRKENYTILKKNVAYLKIGKDTLRYLRKIINPANLDADTLMIGRVEDNFKVAKRAVAVLGIGIGLKYGLTYPLFVRGGDLFLGALLGDTSSSALGGLFLLFASLAANLGGDELIIYGAIRSGFAASNVCRLNIAGMKKNRNWGINCAGLSLLAVEVLSFGAAAVLPFTDAHEAAPYAFRIGVISSNAAYAMFTLSAINATWYTGKALQRAWDSSFEIQLIPTVSVKNKSAGLLLNCSF